MKSIRINLPLVALIILLAGCLPLPTHADSVDWNFGYTAEYETNASFPGGDIHVYWTPPPGGENILIMCSWDPLPHRLRMMDSDHPFTLDHLTSIVGSNFLDLHIPSLYEPGDNLYFRCDSQAAGYQGDPLYLQDVGNVNILYPDVKIIEPNEDSNWSTGLTYKIKWINFVASEAITNPLTAYLQSAENLNNIGMQLKDLTGSVSEAEVKMPLYDISPGKYIIQLHANAIFARSEPFTLSDVTRLFVKQMPGVYPPQINLSWNNLRPLPQGESYILTFYHAKGGLTSQTPYVISSDSGEMEIQLTNSDGDVIFITAQSPDNDYSTNQLLLDWTQPELANTTDSATTHDTTFDSPPPAVPSPPLVPPSSPTSQTNQGVSDGIIAGTTTVATETKPNALKSNETLGQEERPITKVNSVRNSDDTSRFTEELARSTSTVNIIDEIAEISPNSSTDDFILFRLWKSLISILSDLW